MRRVLLAVGAIVLGLAGIAPANAAGAAGNAAAYECGYAYSAIPGGWGMASACVFTGGSASSPIPGTPTTSGPTADGCIYVLTNAGFDGACGTIPTNGLSVTPMLEGAAMNFSLPSGLGGVMSATVTMTGTGVPVWQVNGGPYAYGTLTPTATVQVSGGLFFDRIGTANPGSVVGSTIVGGGSMAGGFADFGRGVYASAAALAP